MSRVQRVEELLLQLQPSHLEVTDFSHGHNVPAGSESHLKVVIAGDIFAGKNKVQRHRTIYACLQEEMNSGLHALQIHAFTEKELESADIAPPPPCKGGSKRS